MHWLTLVLLLLVRCLRNVLWLYNGSLHLVTADVDLKKGNQVNKPMLQNMFCGSSLAVLPLVQTVSEGELIVLLKRFNLDRKLAYQLVTEFMLAFTRIYFLIVSRQKKALKTG